MTLDAAGQWLAFSLCSFLAIAGGLGMATTMSMFRSGIFLMASFVGVAGLFILLSADLMGLLQVMMYVAGMLVMILFMVLFSHDPGGSMMAGMQMAPLERLFSLGLRPMEHGGEHGEHQEHGGGMDMEDMSMTTPVKTPAAILALCTGALLLALLLLRPSWPLSPAQPDPDSARQVGSLLMGPYMMAFEGAGLLILLGIFGSVLVARPASRPARPDRLRPVALEEPPAEVEGDRFEPELADRQDLPRIAVTGVHRDQGSR